jgi:hypothetical protein
MVPLPVEVRIDWIKVRWFGRWQAFTLRRETFFIGNENALK